MALFGKKKDENKPEEKNAPNSINSKEMDIILQARQEEEEERKARIAEREAEQEEYRNAIAEDMTRAAEAAAKAAEREKQAQARKKKQVVNSIGSAAAGTVGALDFGNSEEFAEVFGLAEAAAGTVGALDFGNSEEFAEVFGFADAAAGNASALRLDCARKASAPGKATAEELSFSRISARTSSRRLSASPMAAAWSILFTKTKTGTL